MAGKDKQTGKVRDHAVLLLPGIYNETLMLLAEAHDYFYRYAQQEEAEMDNRVRTMYAGEMSRVTIRLSSVMAWLMARKAVFAGKLTPEEANEHHRLECRDICLNQHIEAESLLPERMTDLLDKTFELYQRVTRLDDLSGKS
jgi:regulator of CtrA degradation